MTVVVASTKRCEPGKWIGTGGVFVTQRHRFSRIGGVPCLAMFSLCAAAKGPQPLRTLLTGSGVIWVATKGLHESFRLVRLYDCFHQTTAVPSSPRSHLKRNCCKKVRKVCWRGNVIEGTAPVDTECPGGPSLIDLLISHYACVAMLNTAGISLAG